MQLPERLPHQQPKYLCVGVGASQSELTMSGETPNRPIVCMDQSNRNFAYNTGSLRDLYSLYIFFGENFRLTIFIFVNTRLGYIHIYFFGSMFLLN